MKKIILNIFLSALAPSKWGILALVYCLAISACGLEEPYGGLKDNDNVIEFVARPVGFNNQTVETKAAANNFEKTIYNCYFLLFDNDSESANYGKLVEKSEAQASQSLKIMTKGLTNVKACFIANVTESTINNIEKIADLEKAISIVYSSHTVADSNLETSGILGIPSVNFGGSIGEKKCIPMFGEVNINLSSSERLITIPLKRLFAKVIVNINISLTNYSTNVITSPDAFFDLKSYTLTNLPLKVNLNSINIDEDNSSWYQKTETGYFADELTIKLQNAKIYDADADNSKKKSHSFYFYVPEYIVQPTSYKDATYESNTNNQKYKQSLIPEDSRPICLTINGILRDNNNKDTSVNYIIYLGGDAYDDFRSLRNTCYVHNVIILGTGHIIDDEDNVEIPPLNLVDMYNQSANCYIISNSGTYQLDTYTGVVKNITPQTSKLIGKPKSEPIWNSSSNVIDIINDDSDTEDKIIFTVNGDTPGNNVSVGNALLALTDATGENILWSWHIWFNTADNRADIEENLDKYPAKDGKWNKVYMMNRALGATRAIDLDLTGWISDLNGFLWRDGLYYQWGRKDPMRNSSNSIDPKEENATYANSILNPTTLYSGWTAMSDTEDWKGWTDEKSTNDPCPPGYKVPHSDVWRDSNPDQSGISAFGQTIHTTTTTAYTYHLQNSSNDGTSAFVFYPYSGNYEADGEFKNKIHIEDSEYTPDEEAYYYPYNVPSIGREYTWLESRPETCRKFRKIKYDFEADLTHGFLWSVEGMLRYGYSTLDLKNNSGNIIGDFFEDKFRSYTCDYMEGRVQYKESGSGHRKKYIVTDIQWSGSWSENKEIKYDVLGSNGYYVVRDAIKSYIKNLQSLNAYTYLIDPEIRSALGCTIRCVKE